MKPSTLLRFDALPREWYLSDGKLVDEGALPHPLRNRGFGYADGFFETIRIVNGRPLYLDLHFGRILDSCRGHKLIVAPDFTLDRFAESIHELTEAKQIKAGGRIRATFFRDGGGRYTPEQDDVRWFAEAQSLPDNDFVLNTKGFTVDIYPEMKKPLNPLANFKNLAASIYVQSAIWARSKELDEALIVNDRHQIIESTRSNLFLASNGVLYTPGLDTGPVGGVMRAAVIHLALQKGLKVYECDLTPQELLRADELFLTNAIRGIQWVSAYRTKRYFNHTSQLITGWLNGQ